MAATLRRRMTQVQYQNVRAAAADKNSFSMDYAQGFKLGKIGIVRGKEFRVAGFNTKNRTIIVDPVSGGPRTEFRPGEFTTIAV